MLDAISQRRDTRAMSTDNAALIRDRFDSLVCGDFDSLRELMEPDAQWLWWEPIPGDCHDRDKIIATLRDRHGLTERDRIAPAALSRCRRVGWHVVAEPYEDAIEGGAGSHATRFRRSPRDQRARALQSPCPEGGVGEVAFKSSDGGPGERRGRSRQPGAAAWGRRRGRRRRRSRSRSAARPAASA